MLTIGLLGGMSWESSAESYRRISELVRDRLGGLHSTLCVLYSVDFAEIEQLQVAGRGALRRPDHRWAAGHRVHDGAGLLSQAAGRERPDGSRTRPRRPSPGAPGDLR
jgi:aspartate racemase